MPRRTRLLLITAASILFSLSLLGGRMVYTNTAIFAFLIWNLCLAAMPLGFSTLLGRVGDRSGLMFVSILGLWLLFFPNAPYIVTDLIHLRGGAGAPVWFDLILIASFSWSGLLMGFISLSDLQEIVKRRYGVLTAGGFAFTALISAAFGIYLGRFLRWNSWDLLTSPASLLNDIADRLLDPLSHPTAVAVTVLLSVLLSLWYLAFRTVFAEPAVAKSGTRVR